MTLAITLLLIVAMVQTALAKKNFNETYIDEDTNEVGYTETNTETHFRDSNVCEIKVAELFIEEFKLDRIERLERVEQVIKQPKEIRRVSRQDYMTWVENCNKVENTMSRLRTRSSVA